MQRSVKSIAVMSFVIVSVGAGIFFGPKQMTPHKQELFDAYARKYKVMGKLNTPFSTNSSFIWIDESTGRGKARVELSGQSFATSTWNYQWVLPEGASSADSISGVLTSPPMDGQIVYEIEVEGLNPRLNQNIVFQAKPTDRADSAIAIAVPSRFEQTLEAKTAIEYMPEQNHSLQKSIAHRRELPRGIQF